MRDLILSCLFVLGCSGVPSAPITEDPTSTSQSTTQEVPIPAPKFIVSREGFGPFRLGMLRHHFVDQLPLSTRLVLSGEAPDGLAGQVFTITNDEDAPLFRMGVVDGQVAWLFAESRDSGVGTSSGVGFGSPLSAVRKTLGEEKPFLLPGNVVSWIEFPKELPNVRFFFDDEKLTKILLAKESLLPNINISLRGVVLPASRVAFMEGGQWHEAEVSAAAPLPAVGAMVDGEGTRQRSGALKLTKQFAVNPSAKDVAVSIQDRARTDADFLSYVSLLVSRHQIAEYRIEALPSTDSAVSLALVIFTSPSGVGYSRLRLSSADGPLEISPVAFGIEKNTYLGSL